MGTAVRESRNVSLSLPLLCLRHQALPFCPGYINEDRTINQRPSVQRIAEVGLNYAKAGAHCVAPSDMMDGRCKAIKELLLQNNLANKCTLMSYSAKFASALYGPFRSVSPLCCRHSQRRSFYATCF